MGLHRRNEVGFTLIELLVVVLILGALAFVAVPRVGQSSTTAKVNACKTNIELQNQQIEYFYHDTGAYPDKGKLKDVSGFEASYFPGGLPTCPFGDKYEYDKGLDRMKTHSH
jgi:prepilin-type N-terminal cleavage/methylation domain-containing protein